VAAASAAAWERAGSAATCSPHLLQAGDTREHKDEADRGQGDGRPGQARVSEGTSFRHGGGVWQ
jgi:hypothetical protein